VTVATIDPIVEHVMEMTELNRLLDVLVRARDVRRASEHHGDADQAAHQQDDASETDLGKRVGTSMENLGHRRLVENGQGGFLFSRRFDLYHVVKKGSSSRFPALNPAQPRDFIGKPVNASTVPFSGFQRSVSRVRRYTIALATAT
jgi:hypothetical protein